MSTSETRICLSDRVLPVSLAKLILCDLFQLSSMPFISRIAQIASLAYEHCHRCFVSSFNSRLRFFRSLQGFGAAKVRIPHVPLSWIRLSPFSSLCQYPYLLEYNRTLCTHIISFSAEFSFISSHHHYNDCIFSQKSIPMRCHIGVYHDDAAIELL